VQGNVDPAVLFAPPEAIEKAVKDVVAKAGPTGHILNLGHGVLVGTPEESVKLFFDTARKCTY
jgi:uroporphyrinogen decarboxylase